jgi:predicted ATP-grasp superfamily ATP-dependent carboligase
VKPIDGAGSEGVELVTGADDRVATCVKPRRLEAFCRGLSASVSLLCGSGGVVALPPCRQILSQDGRLQYQGGSYPLPESYARRARELALRACCSMIGARGYVGVDLVLSDEADPAADVVIEVNPRLTTSYTGLRAATTDNLARAMLAAAMDQVVTVTFRSTPIQFIPGKE